MQRWEYLTLESSRNYGTTKFYVNGVMQPELKNKNLAEVMNLVGTQGWEMVGVAKGENGNTYIFKRAPTMTKPKAPAAPNPNAPNP